MDIQKIRKDFPILSRKINGKQIVYLDNAASTQKPIQVIDSVSDYYRKHNANIHRGLHVLSQEASQMYEGAHKKVSEFINAEYEEVVFLRNATEAINLVMYSYGLNNLEKGDEILTTVMEHHANIVPWQFLKKRGIVLRFVSLKEDGTLDLDDFDKKISGKTKLVAVTQASNMAGTINPVNEIVRKAQKKGALVLIDASQSVPHMKVDFKEMGADFLAFSGHKMLAPTGIGCLVAKKHLLEGMEPFLYGGDMIKQVTKEKSSWNELPWKFEAGTPNIAGAIGMGAAIDYLQKAGMDNIRQHEIELTRYALGQLKDIPGVVIYGPKQAEYRAGLVSFNIKGIHSHDVASILDSDFNVAIRSGHHCAQPLIEHFSEYSSCRASFYIYNTKSEIDILVQGILKAKQVFRK